MRRHGASSPVDGMVTRDGSKSYLAFPWSRGGAAPAYVEELDGLKSWVEKTKDRCGRKGCAATFASSPNVPSLAGVLLRDGLSIGPARGAPSDPLLDACLADGRAGRRLPGATQAAAAVEPGLLQHAARQQQSYLERPSTGNACCACHCCTALLLHRRRPPPATAAARRSASTARLIGARSSCRACDGCARTRSRSSCW